MIIDGDRFGPWALITGASSGIGEEFAHQLAHAGINVVLVARRTAELDRVGTTVAARYGVEFRTLSLDLSEPGVCDTIDTATRDLDIGLLVSNAGDGQPVSFLAEELSSQRRIVRLNVDTQLTLTHLFAHRLVRRGRGGIVLVSALGASHGIPLMTNAAATKAYVSSLGEGLHAELAGNGVHVTVLSPGPTQTPVLAKFGLDGLPVPVPALPVRRCVAEALEALQANRSHCVPGRLNRMIALLPASATRATMARGLGYAMSRAAARPAARPENTQPPRKVPSSER